MCSMNTNSFNVSPINKDDYSNQGSNKIENQKFSPPLDQSDQIYNPIILPFFDNDTALGKWMVKILNNETVQDSPLFFAETDRTGETIIDSKMYFEDFAVLLDGLFKSMGVNDLGIASYFLAQKNFPKRFWDYNATTNGYYSWINETLTENSTIKEFDDNIQPIITFIDWFLTGNEPLNSYGAPSIISTQWSVINNQFAHTIDEVLLGQDIKFFNASTELDGDKYFRDQLLAAIAGFQLHRSTSSEISQSIKDNGKDTANAIMNTLTNSSFEGIDDYYGTFNYKRLSNMRKDLGVSAEIDLVTNAYGIVSLLEWAIESTVLTPENKNKTQLAEKIFNTLNRTLWNSTYSLFMELSTESYGPGNVIDSTISLRSNAIMMSALKRLFEVTGNFTYFETIMKMYDGLKEYFYDEIYGNYFTSLDANSYPLVVNQNKNLNSIAYLYRAFYDIASLSKYAKASISSNMTDLIKVQDYAVNVTFSMDMKILLNYTKISYVLQKNVFVRYPSFYYNVRYPNGTLINNGNSISGNINGTASTLVMVDDFYPNGDYEISFYANYSGIVTQFGATSFSINSGIYIKNYEFLDDTNPVKAGQSTRFNLTINSTRNDPRLFDIKFISDVFTPNTAQNQNITNNTLTTNTYELLSLSTAPFDSSVITVEFWNNSILYYSRNISVIIKSPVELVSISQYQYVLQNQSTLIQIRLKNYLNIQQNCKISISSEKFIGNSTNIQLGSLATSDFSISADLIDNVNTRNENIVYAINISRISDGEVIYLKYFSAIIKPQIEIINFEYSSVIRHNQENYISCVIINYLDSERSIFFTVNDEEFENIGLTPGKNTVLIPLGEFSNPYDFGVKEYTVKIFEELDKDGNSQLIYEKVVSTDLQLSILSFSLGYFLPIGIPIIGMVIARHISLENKKRLS